MNNKTYTRIIGLFFTLNAVFLTWAILWKCGVPFIGDNTQRIVNLVPFHANTQWEMQLNILLFVPFGFLLSSVMAKRARLRILVIVLTSVFLEITQYILAIGRSDITDVLLNILGGLIGIGAYYLLMKIFGKYSHIAVMIASVLIIAFVAYVSVSFILFGMVRLGFMMLRM